MSDPSPDSSPRSLRTPTDLERLKELLVGPEQRRVAELQSRVSDPKLRAQDVAEVLPTAVHVALQQQGTALGQALTPAVEAALRDSIRRDPSTVVGVVFPILGPAIRRAISEALGRLVQSINLALEYGFSWKGWVWRFEAWRTGKSFADVLIYHTLVFRVEEVFLIHRHTGLLLLHAHAPDVAPADSTLVAAMLSAIQDFIRDSFRPESGDGLDQLQLGELHVWIENGPFATLAAVVRGHAPKEYRLLLQRTLEHAHLAANQELHRFKGDPAPFDFLRPKLDDCLQTEYLRGMRPPGRRPRGRLLALAFVGVVLLAWWLVTRTLEHRAWSDYLSRLDSTEGLIVLRSGRDSGHFHLDGLRDPLALDPWSLLPTNRLDPSAVEQRWQPFLSVAPDLVLRRAIHRVPPPDGVQYGLQNAVLQIHGAVPEGWWAQAQPTLLTLPGIDEVRLLDSVQPPPPPSAEALMEDLRRTVILFGNATQLLPGQDALLDRTATAFRQLIERLPERNLSPVVTIVGHTDPTGPAERNALLSVQRAQTVLELLVQRGVPSASLAVEGRGSQSPVVLQPGEDLRRNRRVSFEIPEGPLTPTARTP